MILVTGGAGFIGTHLVEALVARGETVRVFELAAAPTDHLPKTRVEIVRGDIRDRCAVRAAVRGCRQVYHLAGNPNLWTRDRRDFDAVNHRGTVHVLEESLKAGAERVLHVSTESILATRDGSAADPRESLRAEDMIGPYCMSKYLAEEAAFRLARTGAPVLIVNPTLPVGPGDRNRSPPTRMTVAFCRGQLPLYLECQLNLIDVRDVADGMISTVSHGEPGRRYLLGFRNLCLGEWLRLLAKETGRAAPTLKVPYRMALWIASISEFLADHVTHGCPNATVTGVRLTRRSMAFDATESLVALGISPRSIEYSIRDAIRWYREMGWIR